MADAASVTISATILPDEIAKTIAGSMTITPGTNEKWYYKETDVTTGSVDLITGTYLSNKDSNVAHDSIVVADDDVIFLFVKHLSVRDDGTTASDESVVITFDAGAAAHGLTQSVVLEAGETFYARLNYPPVANIHAISCNAGATGTGSNKVKCAVAALIKDGGV